MNSKKNKEPTDSEWVAAQEAKIIRQAAASIADNIEVIAKAYGQCMIGLWHLQREEDTKDITFPLGIDVLNGQEYQIQLSLIVNESVFIPEGEARTHSTILCDPTDSANN